MKEKLNTFAHTVKKQCIDHFTNMVKSQLTAAKSDNGTKLSLYAHIKNDYKYESYLDSNHSYKNELSKFRLSSHWLPIERGRYARPKIDRIKRICIMCNKALGNEIHAMFRCTHPAIKNVTTRFLGEILDICPQLRNFSDKDRMVYLLKGSDTNILHPLFSWLGECNAVYKKAYNKTTK